MALRQTLRYLQAVLIGILLIPMLWSCSNGSQSGTPTPIPTDQSAPSPRPVATPTQVGEIATPPQTAAPGSAPLTRDQLLKYKPNELGSIPIFMYHNIVTDPTKEGHLYRTVDELYADLQWLYDNDFSMVGMNDVVRGTFDVPLGKHPVVWTFDDSSSMHFSIQIGPDGKPVLDEHGQVIPTPNCAVGILERFKREHPYFNVTAHFGMIPQFKFSWPEFEQDEYVGIKMQWLLDHGYEIGNHTWDHVDMSTLGSWDFARNVGDPVVWSSKLVDTSNPNYAFGILTLPFGGYPESGWQGDQFMYLKDGFPWEGQDIKVEGVLLVCCGPVSSPFSNAYSRLWIPRMRGDDPDYASLEAQIKSGEVLLYTSDGNPQTVTIPWPLPESLWGQFNESAVTSRNLTLVKYNPESGKIYDPHRRRKEQGYTEGAPNA